MSILLTLFLTSAALVALLSANLWVVRVHKALETLAVVILAPIVLAAILLDRVVGRANPFIWFPRNEREIMAEPPRFFALLKASKSSRLPTDAQLLSISRRPGIESEPGKANLGTSFILRVAYSAGGKQAELDLFIKASSERRIPAWIKAVLAITTTGSPEIDLFLALESGKLSLSTPVPRMLFGAASRLFHRSLLVLEFTPSTKMVNIPDWKAINASYAASVIDLLVPMHARHWRRSGECLKSKLLC